MEQIVIDIVKKVKEDKRAKYCAIFDYGTVVFFDMTEDDLSEYDREEYDFPMHRLTSPGALENIVGQVNDFYKKVCKKGKELKLDNNIIGHAYNALMMEGYPYPGTPESDRSAIKIKDNTWLVHFGNPDKTFNVVDKRLYDKDINMMTALTLGGEARRMDNIAPVSKYIIDISNMKVYNLQD